MRKLLVSMLAVLVLGLGSAFAQEGVDNTVTIDSDYWGGLSIGYPFGVNFHFGIEDVIGGGTDVRFNGGFTFGGGLGLGADVLVDLPIDTGATPIDIYVGGGAALAVGGEFGFDLNLLVGGEYRLGDIGLPEGGVFLEVGPTLNVVPAFGANVNAKVGFNYHF